MNRQKLTGLLLFLLSLLCVTGTAAAFRLYLEAEEARDLQRYPYDNEDCPTWYGREANIRGWAAPGRAWCAAIHETATNIKAILPLKEILPAGRYLVFLRTIGPTAPDRETVVRLMFGEIEANFSWRSGQKRFRWQPPAMVALKQPVREISFEVIQFGGRGYGGLTEPLSRTVWLDTIYLTDDLQEKEPPDYFAEIAWRAGLKEEVSPRPVYDSDEAYQTPLQAREARPTPIILKGYDGRRNLWPNSSFELGMNDGWAAARPYVFSDQDLENRNAFHGRYCLKLPAGVEPFSRPYYLPEAARYCLSFYVRSPDAGRATFLLKKVAEEKDWQKNQVVTTVALKKEFTLSPDWQRVTVSGQLEKGWYYLSFSGPEFYLDAIQLEKGEKPTTYAPRGEVEGALRTGWPGNILYDNQRELLLYLHHSGQQLALASLAYRVVDVRERTIAEGKTAPVKLKPGQTIVRPVKLLPESRGIFSVLFSLAGRDFPEGETVYVVMPQPPQQPTRHQLGANISLTPAEIQVQARLGLKWVLTCKTREIASADEGVHPRPDVWNWADEKALYPSRFGMNLLPCFWPHRIPPFLQEKLDDPGRYRTVRGRDQQYRPRLDLWSDYVSTVASHYRKVVQHWCVDDEAECSWTPDYYAPVVAATADAVHKAVPEAKVGLSATPEFTEELFRYVSPEKIDFLGGSFFDYYYHEAKYLNQLKQRYRKPVISFGVGGRPPENTMYHTLYTFQPPYFKAAWMARLLVYQMLVSDLDISGHYAGILRNDGAHLGLNKPLCDYDGTPYPWGATFGCLGTLLADAQPCGEVPLGTTGRLVFLFQTRNKLAGVTWSTNVPENDMHWKPAVRKLKKVQLACPPGSIELFDMYWNKLAGIRQQKKTISFDLEEEPVFIINQKLSPEQFRKIFETCQVAPEPVEMELWPQASVSGEISLRITVKNNTSSTYRQALVDFRYPNPVSSINNPLSTAGSWLVPKAISLPSLAGKETKVVNVACAYQADYPLEAAVLRTVFKAEECETASDHWLWLVPCFPINIKLDGLLDEWEKKPASWLAYQRHWNFSYRWSQFLEGEGSFGYPSYTLDSRVAFWAGYDRENLYLAVRAEDEQILPAGELIRIFLAVAPEKPFRLDIEVPEKEKWSARLTTAQSQSLPEPAISGKVQEKQFTLEVAVPWKSLQLSPEPGKILAFDLYRTDVDVENGKKESGTMHWAGGARYGYLILR